MIVREDMQVVTTCMTKHLGTRFMQHTSRRRSPMLYTSLSHAPTLSAMEPGQGKASCREARCIGFG